MSIIISQCIAVIYIRRGARVAWPMFTTNNMVDRLPTYNSSFLCFPCPTGGILCLKLWHHHMWVVYPAGQSPRAVYALLS